MGFKWNEDEEDLRPRCVICYEQRANESMHPNKLLCHVETKHPKLKHKPLDFFKKLLANLKMGQRILHCYTNLYEKSLCVLLENCESWQATHNWGETLVFSAIEDTDKVFFGDKSENEIESDKSEKEIESIPISNSHT